MSRWSIRIKWGEVRIGKRVEKGDGLAVLMVHPRSDGTDTTVGVVAGTGAVANALANRLRYFVSGIAFPDLMLVGAEGLKNGCSKIRAWGYFGSDWSPHAGDIAWRVGE